ncbi:MAG: prephenate dehydratase [Myxococcota bacterium]
MIRAGFQGEAGAYSEAALLEALGSEAEPVPLESFDAVFSSLEGSEIDVAVLPIENSLAGSIHRNYDLLLRYDAHIIAEHSLRVRHHLLALPGTQLEDVQEVISHPQALSQCEAFLDDLGVERRPMYDTAGSAKLVREEQLQGVAAIASERASIVYDLDVLAAGIEDAEENFTRFLILSNEAETPPVDISTKTSLVFSLRDEPSVLFKALSVFALRDIDLTKIESRPLRERRWKYFFYLDISGSVDDEAVQNALRHLEEIATFLRVLGSYPEELALEQRQSRG